MKKMLIALLTAASLHATAQTEGNKTLLPEKTADTLQLINPKLAPLSPDSLLPSVMVRKPADGLKLNQNFTNYDRTSNLSFANQSFALFHLWKGADVIVTGYQDEMSGLMATSTGRWTTEPIVTPYVKLGKSKMEFPIGNILKTLIWGDRDNPMRFRPPVPSPTTKIKKSDEYKSENNIAAAAAESTAVPS